MPTLSESYVRAVHFEISVPKDRVRSTDGQDEHFFLARVDIPKDWIFTARALRSDWKDGSGALDLSNALVKVEIDGEHKGTACLVESCREYLWETAFRNDFTVVKDQKVLLTAAPQRHAFACGGFRLVGVIRPRVQQRRLA